MVLSAGLGGDAQSQQALELLCKTYWYPLYAYVRRRGYEAHAAQDLTQEFFAYLLEKNRLQLANRRRGKFRTFLLSSLENFLAKHWRQANAQKRGGGRFMLSLDFSCGEQRFQLEPANETTAEMIFERRWALTLLDQVWARVEEDFASRGKSEQFAQLKPYIIGEAAPYAELAAAMEMSEGAVRVAIHRLRRRWRELLREEISHTVADPEDIDDELRRLFQTLRGEG